LKLSNNRSASRLTTIENQLKHHFKDAQLQIEDESYKHHNGRGKESHFKVLCVSDTFANMSTLERHRLIYSILENELNNGLKALALKCLTFAEFNHTKQSFSSPDCIHNKPSKT